MSLHEYLEKHGIIGIEGIDTRALTLRLRNEGALRGVITTEIDDPAECVRLAQQSPSQEGLDLVRVVAPKESYDWSVDIPPVACAPGSDRGPTPSVSPRELKFAARSGSAGASPSPIGNRQSAIENQLVVAIDCGMKRNILRNLSRVGCKVRVMPPTVSAADVFDQRPDGVFVSNGPGDPAAVHYAIDLLKGLIGRVPIFGICLGHQLVALAMGARTFKLKFGHRGANQPVRNLLTGRVEITSQNHGFAVETGSLESAGGVPTHMNLNDHTLEGFIHKEFPLLAVQYHPEASPGPHDATYLFDCFAKMMATNRPLGPEEVAAAQHGRSDRSHPP